MTYSVFKLRATTDVTLGGGGGTGQLLIYEEDGEVSQYSLLGRLGFLSQLPSYWSH